MLTEEIRALFWEVFSTSIDSSKKTRANFAAAMNDLRVNMPKGSSLQDAKFLAALEGFAKYIAAL